MTRSFPNSGVTHLPSLKHTNTHTLSVLEAGGKHIKYVNVSVRELGYKYKQ